MDKGFYCQLAGKHVFIKTQQTRKTSVFCQKVLLALNLRVTKDTVKSIHDSIKPCYWLLMDNGFYEVTFIYDMMLVDPDEIIILEV